MFCFLYIFLEHLYNCFSYHNNMDMKWTIKYIKVFKIMLNFLFF